MRAEAGRAVAAGERRVALPVAAVGISACVAIGVRRLSVPASAAVGDGCLTAYLAVAPIR